MFYKMSPKRRKVSPTRLKIASKLRNAASKLDNGAPKRRKVTILFYFACFACCFKSFCCSGVCAVCLMVAPYYARFVAA